MQDLILILADTTNPHGTTLSEMLDAAIDMPTAEFGIVAKLTGEIELYDLTYGERPLLVQSARLTHVTELMLSA